MPGANSKTSRPTYYMKMTFLPLLGCFMAAIFSTTGLASVVLEVTPAYMREHPKE